MENHNIPSDADIQLRAMNERKKTSRNYAKWQNAIALRDRIISMDGLNSIEYKQVIQLIKYWSAEWKHEVENMEVSLNDKQLTSVLEVELQEMRNNASVSEKTEHKDIDQRVL